MPHFKLRVEGLVTGSTANAFTTLLGIKYATTTGHRARLRKLLLGGSGAAPQDVQLSVRMQRTNNTADGTSTAVNVNTIAKADPGSLASNVSAIGKNYSAEPTNYENGILGVGAFNSRGTLIMEWGPDEAPVWGPTQSLGIQVAPGSATATYLEATLEFEEF
jgi:hypothetical protein